MSYVLDIKSWLVVLSEDQGLALEEYFPVLEEDSLHFLALLYVYRCHLLLYVLKSQMELFEEGDYLVYEACAGVEEHFFVGVLDVQAEFGVWL